MNSLVLTGTIIVFFALSSYSIFIFTEQRKKQVVKKVLLFLTLGIALDITATTFMIIGSSKGLITLHGVLGYSSKNHCKNVYLLPCFEKKTYNSH